MRTVWHKWGCRGTSNVEEDRKISHPLAQRSLKGSVPEKEKKQVVRHE